MHPETHAHRLTHRRAVRLGLGALAATAALTALPAIASAATTCTYDGSTVTVNMDGGPGRALTIQRNGADDAIVVGAQGEAGQFCRSPGGFVTARLRNTSKIKVRSAINPAGTDTVIIDESRGVLANNVSTTNLGNRPQILVLTGTGNDTLLINGTNERDFYTAIGGTVLGHVFLSQFSAAPDVIMTSMGRLIMNGNGGDDFISGHANFPDGGTTVRTEIYGGAGRDMLTVGESGSDRVEGGTEEDYVQTLNGKGGDFAVGGDGPVKDFINGDAGDSVQGFETKSGGVGKLKLASRTVTASTAKPGVLSMSWTHPKAWKNLRDITVKAYDGAKQVGAVTIKPRSERITGSGALKLAASETSIAKKGKAVTVRLGLLATKALAGKTLRLDVHAADRNGKRQIEVDAAELRVAK